jgi:hypothetical protein
VVLTPASPPSSSPLFSPHSWLPSRLASWLPSSTPDSKLPASGCRLKGRGSRLKTSRCETASPCHLVTFEFGCWVLCAGCWTLDVRASPPTVSATCSTCNTCNTCPLATLAAPAAPATLARPQCPQCPQRRQRPLCPQCSQRPRPRPLPRPRRLGLRLRSRARAEQLRRRGESLSVPQWHRHCAGRGWGRG